MAFVKIEVKTELKHCPHCGCEDIFTRATDPRTEETDVVCRKCGARTTGENLTEAVLKWNKRVDECNIR